MVSGTSQHISDSQLRNPHRCVAGGESYNELKAGCLWQFAQLIFSVGCLSLSRCFFMHCSVSSVVQLREMTSRSPPSGEVALVVAESCVFVHILGVTTLRMVRWWSKECEHPYIAIAYNCNCKQYQQPGDGWSQMDSVDIWETKTGVQNC